MFIRSATRQDIPAAAAVAAATYIDDEQDAFIFPGRFKHPERYLKTKESILRHGMDDHTARVIVAVLEEGDKDWSGKTDIMGFCIWYRDDDDSQGREKANSVKKQLLIPRLKAFISTSEAFQYARDLFDPLVSAPNASTMARTCGLPSSKHYTVSDVDKPSQYGIMDIAVRPEFQGRGVAMETGYGRE